MTNNELEQLLKNVQVPERENSFREQFARTVMSEIERRSLKPITRSSRNSHRALWGIGLATACLVFGFWFGFRGEQPGQTGEQLSAARKYFQNVEALFPNQVRAIIFENGEARLLLSDKPDMPAAAPLFVKIRSGKSWRSLVTFSGQRIQINGEPFDVLADHQQQILLVGNNSIWSSDDPVKLNNRIVHAQFLEL